MAEQPTLREQFLLAKIVELEQQLKVVTGERDNVNTILAQRATKAVVELSDGLRFFIIWAKSSPNLEQKLQAKQVLQTFFKTFDDAVSTLEETGADAGKFKVLSRDNAGGTPGVGDS
jgi:hypothetical protein